MTRALLLAFALGLSACATPATYAPAARQGGPGYFATKIENDRYRVTYNGAANETQASDFALLQAAELTLANGYDWFIVDQRSTDRPGSGNGPRISVGGGTSTFGHHTSVGAGVGVGFSLGGGAKSSVSLEIRLGHGPKPADVNAYDARQVQATVRPRV